MPAYTVEILENEMKNIGKTIKEVNIGILGLAYKKDVDDTRESPALKIIDILKSQGAKVISYDPFVKGDVKLKDRKDAYDEINTADNQVVIATYGVAAVGINIPRIFNLVLIEPGKSFVRVIQSIGRGVRKAKDKDFVQIWDLTSTCKFAKRHLTQRKKFYKEAEYPFTIEKVDWK